MGKTHFTLNRAALHDFIFTLWYPAILGSMIVTLILTGQTPPEGVAPWGWVLVFYFAAQHTVAMELRDRSHYPLHQLVQHLIEVVLIVLNFHMLGALPEAALLDGNTRGEPIFTARVLLGATFLLPVLFRAVFRCKEFREGRGGTLSVMSTAAFLCAVIWPGSEGALVAVAFILGVYFVVFVVMSPPAG